MHALDEGITMINRDWSCFRIKNSGTEILSIENTLWQDNTQLNQGIGTVGQNTAKVHIFLGGEKKISPPTPLKLTSCFHFLPFLPAQEPFLQQALAEDPTVLLTIRKVNGRMKTRNK